MAIQGPLTVQWTLTYQAVFTATRFGRLVPEHGRGGAGFVVSGFVVSRDGPDVLVTIIGDDNITAPVVSLMISLELNGVHFVEWHGQQGEREDIDLDAIAKAVREALSDG